MRPVEGPEVISTGWRLHGEGLTFTPDNLLDKFGKEKNEEIEELFEPDLFTNIVEGRPNCQYVCIKAGLTQVR